MLALAFALISSVAGLFGGLLALTQRRNVELALALTAGLLLGLVAFDLLPEIFDISSETGLNMLWPMVAFIAGFIFFHSLEKFILLHHAREKDYAVHRHPYVGLASSAALIGHSFLDGLSIGLAFQVNEAVGVAVSIAVVAHRLADGFNSVNIMLINGSSKIVTLRVLAAVVAAPVMGLAASALISLPESALAVYLGFFAGFMLYISASEILPQAHTKNANYKSLILTVVGIVAMLGVSLLA